MITITIIVVLIATIYYYSTRAFKYWEKRGIKNDKPLPLVGNNLRGFLLKSSMTQLFEEMYWNHPNEKAVGYYAGFRPQLIIKDPELVKRILLTDFMSFYQRGIMPHKTVFEPLAQNIFFAEGDLWKLLRQRMTPAFTTGKLKAMFPLIVERAGRLQTLTAEESADGKSIDAKELMARYTTDFIGACGFGIDSDSLKDENSMFRQLGKKIFKVEISNFIVAVLKETAPETFKNWKIFGRVEADIMELLGEILKKRNYKPCGRSDFIDLMLECKLKGTIVGESMTRFTADGTPEKATVEFNDGVIAAQLFIFFAAGFETSSSTTSYTLHQFAFNQDAQKKAQDEIDRILAKYDGKLCYDAIKDMSYLEWSLKEGMRMFPSVGFLLRQCTKPYKIPELNLIIDEGMRVIIPVQQLQNDPKYFKNPQEFRPERFDPKEFDPSNKYIYLPFGEGPRACIGERLGLMQSVAGLAAVLSRFTVHPAPETKRYPIVDPKSSMIQNILGGLPLLFRERRTKSQL